MEKEILDNIFAPQKYRTTYGKVVGRIGSTKYKIEDDIGRIHLAESTNYYPIGTQVRVQNKEITGRGRLAGNHKFYEV